MFGGQLLELFVDLQLCGICFVIGVFDGCLVQLEFEIVVLAEQPLVPQDRLLGCFEVAGRNMFWDLAAKTCRTADQPFVILLQFGPVGTRTHVETLGPGLRDDLDQVVITFGILGQEYEVVSALVFFDLLVGEPAAGDIHLAADDRFEIWNCLQISYFCSGLRGIEPELLADGFGLVQPVLDLDIGFGTLGRFVF